MELHSDRRTAAGALENFDEAWVAIYNATDGEPKTSNLLGQYFNLRPLLGYKKICDGKAAKLVNKYPLCLVFQYFIFELMDTELLENLRSV